MMNNKKCKIFIVFFFLICMIPSVGLCFFGSSDPAANEILSAQPRLNKPDGSLNQDFFSDAADWFNDRFFLRQRLSSLWAELNAFLFQTSVRDNVILGKNGWLYFGDTLNDYCGVPLSDEVICASARHLSEIWKCCRENNIQFVFTVAPNKNSIYPENMPSRFPMGDSGNVSRLYTELEKQGIPYINLHEVLRNSEETLYFHTDSHWNAKGAALAADAILTSLGVNSGYSSSEFGEGALHYGDLSEMLFPAEKAAESDFIYFPGFTFRPVTDSRDGNAIEFSTKCSVGKGKLLCFRDSFGNALYPYLAEQFAEADFSRSTDYDLQRIRDGQYDVVILEIVERNISWLAR